jgi:hypothetical protein
LRLEPGRAAASSRPMARTSASDAVGMVTVATISLRRLLAAGAGAPLLAVGAGARSSPRLAPAPALSARARCSARPGR